MLQGYYALTASMINTCFCSSFNYIQRICNKNINKMESFATSDDTVRFANLRSYENKDGKPTTFDRE
jgi:hypothetical protein